MEFTIVKSPRLAQFAHDSQRVIEIAVDRDDLRSVSKSLK